MRSFLPVAAVDAVPVDYANQLLVERWGHNLGACNRPFHQEAYALFTEQECAAVAISASIVSGHVTDEHGRQWQRGEVVELARLAGEPWATRVMLRLWREVCAPLWASWPVTAAVSYSQNQRGDGRMYRFDGWTAIRRDAGTSGGGGAWTRPRYATDAARGPKTLWMWRYPVDVESVDQVPLLDHREPLKAVR